MSKTYKIEFTIDELITAIKSAKAYQKKHQRKNSDFDDKIKYRKGYDLQLKFEEAKATDVVDITEYQSIDYFMELNNWLFNECVDEDNVFPRAYSQFRNDLFAYREASIKQYNNNVARGTDAFCLKKFLNDYKTSIMIFNLHSEIEKSDLLALINIAWDFLHTHGEDRV